MNSTAGSCLVGSIIPTPIKLFSSEGLGVGKPTRKSKSTKSYWKKIKEVKHTEIKFSIPEVKKTLKDPGEVRKSVTDTTILLYAKKIEKYDILIVAVKVLNSDGFLVTTYQTKEYKKKGQLVWQKQKEK